jgi:hypothetical protein
MYKFVARMAFYGYNTNKSHNEERPVDIMALPQKKLYTIDDIYALPDGQRAELIDGQIYMMSPPRRIHQECPGLDY